MKIILVVKKQVKTLTCPNNTNKDMPSKTWILSHETKENPAGTEALDYCASYATFILDTFDERCSGS